MSRRPDLADMREVLDPRKTSVSTGLVVKPPHEPSHYVIEARDVYVWVKLVPAETLKLCRLGALGSGRTAVPEGDITVDQGVGIWSIPQVGTEVEVTIPHGEIRADAVITNTLSTGIVPAELTNDQVIVIKHRKVTIRAVGTSGGVKLTTLGGDVEIKAEAMGVQGGTVTIDADTIVLNGGTANVARQDDDVSLGSGQFDARYVKINPGDPATTFTGTITEGNPTVKA